MSELSKYGDIIGKIIGGIVVLIVAVILKMLITLSGDLAKLETHIMDGVMAQNTAYIQLSSAVTQEVIGKQSIVNMELRDAGYNIHFDPRLSAADIEVSVPGAYFILAAPQMQYVTNSKSCLDMFLRIEGRDMANSNVRLCLGTGYTGVLISQAITCLKEGDTINVIIEGNGIESMEAVGSPLIPSIIFSMFRIGQC